MNLHLEYMWKAHGKYSWDWIKFLLINGEKRKADISPSTRFLDSVCWGLLTLDTKEVLGGRGPNSENQKQKGDGEMGIFLEHFFSKPHNKIIPWMDNVSPLLAFFHWLV